MAPRGLRGGGLSIGNFFFRTGKKLFLVLLYANDSNWKNSHRLSEKLASLGTMGDRLRALLKPLNGSESAVMVRRNQVGPQLERAPLKPFNDSWWPEGIKRALNWSLMMPRNTSLSDSCLIAVPIFKRPWRNTCWKLKEIFANHWYPRKLKIYKHISLSLEPLDLFFFLLFGKNIWF